MSFGRRLDTPSGPARQQWSELANTRAFITVVTAAWVMLVLGAYIPDLGRGFVQDDFAWVLAARDALHNPGSLIGQRTPGFFRPVVTLTFAADHATHGLDPRGYGF